MARPSGTPVTGRPSTVITPESGRSRPARQRRSVVFPQPDGPAIVTNWPCSAVKDRSPSTGAGAAGCPRRPATGKALCSPEQISSGPRSDTGAPQCGRASLEEHRFKRQHRAIQCPAEDGNEQQARIGEIDLERLLAGEDEIADA